MPQNLLFIAACASATLRSRIGAMRTSAAVTTTWS
jgi:hypothetical protein